MKKHLFLSVFVIMSILFIAACSDDERVNPEDTLEAYIRAWENFAFAEMLTVMNGESMDVLENQEWTLEERMEKVYGDLGVDNIQVSYEPRDFEEEEIDLDEVEELVYPVQVTMPTIAGELDYDTEIKLVKVLETDENDNETEKWLVQWLPNHVFAGMEKATDRIRISTEQPVRGEIYDRNGEGLAINGQIYDIWMVPEVMEDVDAYAEAFAELFDMDVEAVQEIVNQYPDNPDWRAPAFQVPVNDPRVQELANLPRGTGWESMEGREYPYGIELAHLVGHIGPITAEELEKHEGKGYNAQSTIGKRGLELEYEDLLRGEAGVSVTILDEEGNTRHVVLKTEPVHGEDIHLTIDARLQAQLSATLGSDAGTGVVMNPMTGEVLALVSQPSFDSNIRYLGIRDSRADNFEDTSILYDRRFQNSYSPGSVFKPFTAAIGLEEGTLDPNESLSINGRQWQPDSSWGSYQITRVNEHISSVDLETGMKYSDNIYFAQQALAIGDSTFEAWAEKLGFGSPIPFSFPMYASTIANEGLNSDILLGDTGYGQGEVLMNPLHLTALYTMFVNDGTVVQPVLFSDEEMGEAWLENIVSPETAGTVLDSLVPVVEDTNGTAYRTDPGHNRSIAGKTGTAELKKSQQAEDGEQLGWYVALDYENKDILVTMMIENVEGRGGSGYVVNKVNEFLSRAQ
ncbi:penicillin-binding protein [Evansella vedderi]|uniref:serine-type D-Ala-D-Ala carboxypeptidase n=1 Tax=Evansella vedderi TaxID=38282 RepID=A0ABU0A108_9BACI|nr:penicillin-binding transpeptidase domain-containing protein [Evansella vedderi]MDQ0256661.1 penicillin-binding protein [Evansella vedderi]